MSGQPASAKLVILFVFSIVPAWGERTESLVSLEINSENCTLANTYKSKIKSPLDDILEGGNL